MYAAVAVLYGNSICMKTSKNFFAQGHRKSIAGGRIVAAGSNAEIRTLAGPATKQWIPPIEAIAVTPSSNA